MSSSLLSAPLGSVLAAAYWTKVQRTYGERLVSPDGRWQLRHIAGRGWQLHERDGEDGLLYVRVGGEREYFATPEAAAAFLQAQP